MSGEMGGTQDVTTVEQYEAARQGSRRGVRSYGPTQLGDKGSGVGLLEAEFFGIIFLLVIALLFGTPAYGDKMMAFMKRGTLTAILFFFLALIASIGPNASKIAKGLGALVFVMILISTPGQEVITALDGFFKSAWVGTSESNTASSDTGTSGATTGVIGNAENAASGAASKISEIQIPGIGPIFAAGTVIDSIKKLFHL